MKAHLTALLENIQKITSVIPIHFDLQRENCPIYSRCDKASLYRLLKEQNKTPPKTCACDLYNVLARRCQL